MSSPASAQPAVAPALHSVTLGKAGPVVVFLHGWGRSLDSLRPLAEILADSYRAVLLDLPGFGRSELPYAASNDGGGWSTIEYSESVRSWLQHAGISECILVGHSFGGRLSIRLAAKYPSLIKAVVLIGTPGLPVRHPLGYRLRLWGIRRVVSIAKAIDGMTGFRLFKHYLAPRFGSRDYLAAGNLKRTLSKTVTEDLTEEARSIQAPTLMLWGENDKEALPSVARGYQKLIQRSELFIFPNKGHDPFTDVGSHLMAQYIDTFFKKVGLRGA